MADVVTGSASNVTTPLVATVSALANNGGGQVRVLTSAPHLFGQNDQVDVETTALRGTFQIVVIDATHFDLVGSTYATTGTGTATDLSLTPQIQIPTDGDSSSMQLGLLSAVQAILDRTQFLAKRGFSGTAVFTASGTWVCPANVYSLLVTGCGGGGGGEGSQAGQAAVSGAAEVLCTGGGGAGAPYHFEVVNVTPGLTYNVGVGAGGAGGTAGNPGNDGFESYFRLNTGRPTYSPDVQMPGGGGAGAPASVAASGEVYALQGSNGCMIAPGGDAFDLGERSWPFTPIRADGATVFAGLKLVSSANLTNILSFISKRPGAGGACVCAPDTDYAAYGSQSQAGNESEQEYAGGAPGTIGATGTGGGLEAPGGAAGGGGGGGPFGPGGAGGNGGAGSHTGAGSQGTAGTAAAANTGAGGGGGGGGGWAVSSGFWGAGIAGGNGGSGLVVLFWQTAAAGA